MVHVRHLISPSSPQHFKIVFLILSQIIAACKDVLNSLLIVSPRTTEQLVDGIINPFTFKFENSYGDQCDLRPVGGYLYLFFFFANVLNILLTKGHEVTKLLVYYIFTNVKRAWNIKSLNNH